MAVGYTMWTATRNPVCSKQVNPGHFQGGEQESPKHLDSILDLGRTEWRGSSKQHEGGRKDGD